MMAIIIGKNRVQFMRVKKKDLDKHFFRTRGQRYMIYPEVLRPMEVYHNGAWIESESVVIFPENGTLPYNCRYPELYEMDSMLSKTDEVKLMCRSKKGGFDFGKLDPNKIWDWIPLIVLGLVGLYVLWGMIF